MLKIIKDIEFRNSTDRLIIKKDTIKIFSKYSPKKGTNESGGIIIGSVYPKYTEVTRVTTPNRFDFAGFCFFNRSKTGAQPKINKAWGKSDGTSIYLGEWHTHSEIKPTPSCSDKHMIKEMLKMTIMTIDFLYLVIVGNNNTYWVGRQTKKTLDELKMVTRVQ